MESSDGKSRVLAAVNLVELISGSVKLIRRGGKYVGLCPFHQEKSPSFQVDPAKQFFYCFGCKTGGNAIDFVMKRDRLNFVESLQLLAQQYHVELPRFGGASKEKASERQTLLDIHSIAATVFQKNLGDGRAGESSRKYLADRGFTPETIKRFGVGLALPSWDNLLLHPELKRFPRQQLATAGLVKPKDDRYYDTFRNRVMFPIHDEQGRIIAFGGRVAPGSDDPAKYLNSPETPLFSKSKVAFGLHLGKQRIVETRTVAIVEGYTDVMMAHQFGVSNVVSVLGTALTEQHVALLRRFADKIVLLFDGDNAGEMAVNRAVELFLTQPIEIAIATLPDGLDPDEFLLEKGAEAFSELLASGQDALSFKWKQLQRSFNENDDLTGQQKAVEAYLEMLANARGTGPIDSIRWGSALARVSRLTDIPVDQLNRRFGKVAPKSQAQPQARPAVKRAAPQTAADRAECWILGALLLEPSRWQSVQTEIHPQDFSNPDRKSLAEVYWNYQRDEGEPAFHELLAALQSDDLKSLAVNLHDAAASLSDLDRAVADGIKHLQTVAHQTDGQKLLSQLRRTPNETSSEMDEVELLKNLQQRRQNDIHRSAG